MPVISTSWLNARRPHWTRLEELLDRAARHGMRGFGHQELQELGLLYRQIGADLATLREDPASGRFAQYVERLLARAHHTIYVTDRQHPVRGLASFLWAYPSVFRQHLLPCALSAVIVLAGAALGTALTYRNPDFKTAILGPEMVKTIERREMWTHSIVAMKPLASSAIMTNNITVSLTAFAAGITAGVGTIYMLFLNGMLLGVIGTACAVAGMGVALWSFVAPHGSLELPAIVIAGGAGLRLAGGLLFPGVLPRAQSVAAAGGDAVKLALGCIPLLVIAGVIEAFVSPTDLAVPLKFAMGAALSALLCVYLFAVRSGSAASPRDTR
jgi:uncharacterized membrane protein SpoIIM required for sporulation